MHTSLHGKIKLEEYPVVKDSFNPCLCQAIPVRSFNKLKTGQWIDIYNYITAKLEAKY